MFSISETLFAVCPRLSSEVPTSLQQAEDAVLKKRAFDSSHPFILGLERALKGDYPNAYQYLNACVYELPGEKGVVYKWLAWLAWQLRQPALALFYLEQAQLLAPQDSTCELAKVLVLVSQGRVESAWTLLEEGCQSHRGEDLYLWARATISMRKEWYFQAKPLYEDLIQRFPGEWRLHEDLGVCLWHCGELERIPAYCALILGNHPQSESWWSAFSPAQQFSLKQSRPFYHALLLRSLWYQSEVSDTELLNQTRLWADMHLNASETSRASQADAEKAPREPPLKVAYLFTDSSQLSMINHVFLKHGPRFEIWILDETPGLPEGALLSQNTHWIKTGHLSHEEFCSKCEQEWALDILVNLSENLSQQRIRAFVDKPVACLVNFHFMPLGLETVDLNMNAFGESHHQKPVPVFWSEANMAFHPSKKPGSHFYCDQPVMYINEPLLAQWIQLLHETESLLFYSLPDEQSETQKAIEKKWGTLGMPLEQVVFLPPNQRPETSGVYLNTFPLCDLNRLCQSLWMNEPVVSLSLSHFQKRALGAHLLASLNLPGVVHSLEGYRQQALQWLDPNQRPQNLKKSLDQTPILTSSAYIDALEAIYHRALGES